MNNILALNPPIAIRSIFTFNLKSFWLLGFVLGLIFFVVCIFQLNAYTRDVYLIQSYEIEISKLTQENRFLEINFSRDNSLNNIGSFVQNGNFERVKEMEYIRVLEKTVAARWHEELED